MQLAASGAARTVLAEAFPTLPMHELPGIQVRYPKKGGLMPAAMALQSPRIVADINREHAALDALIGREKLQGVVSDNRYGLWSKRIPSVFVTHQLNIQAPLLSGVLHKLQLQFVRHFTRIWVPDVATNPGLAGSLVRERPLPSNTAFVGPLSRFKPTQKQTAPRYRVLGMVSGPEPQRSLFEETLTHSLMELDAPCALVAGRPNGPNTPEQRNKLTVFPHLETQALQELICSSEHIIARSGYSTIMDLATLERTAFWVPTPGQTEQEYLAKHLAHWQHGWCGQEAFSLDEALQPRNAYWPELPASKSLLLEAAQAFVRSLRN